MEKYWNNKFSSIKFAYGTEPSVYVKEILPQLKQGKILFPAEGEGRNSVFAAQLGWIVSAFDFSTVGKEKAEALAKQRGVTIDYTVAAFLEEEYALQEFDAVVLSSVHFEPEIKTEMLNRLDSYLKPGGYFVIDCFSCEHRELNRKNPAVGGPPNADMMFSIEEIKEQFSNYDIVELRTERLVLNEGNSHVGESAMIRFVGKKSVA